MTTYQILGIVSPIVSALGYIPYIVMMARGKTKPHPLSWFLWGVVGLVSLVTYIGVGAHETLPLAILNFVGPTFIFFFTIKYWSGGFSFFDKVCFVMSLVALVVYLLFHTAAFALTINLAGDCFAYLPTIRKTYYDPGTENFSTWFLFTLGSGLSILAIPHWTYGVQLLPMYLTASGIIMCFLILRKRLKKAQ